MADKRVVRGNTYAAAVIPVSSSIPCHDIISMPCYCLVLSCPVMNDGCHMICDIMMCHSPTNRLVVFLLHPHSRPLPHVAPFPLPSNKHGLPPCHNNNNKMIQDALVCKYKRMIIWKNWYDRCDVIFVFGMSQPTSTENIHIHITNTMI